MKVREITMPCHANRYESIACTPCRNSLHFFPYYVAGWKQALLKSIGENTAPTCSPWYLKTRSRLILKSLGLSLKTMAPEKAISIYPIVPS